ncbi:release factor glutamine methyltransferase [Paracoccus isoporae]|uniref:Release factor glutamine methyltransferase n=1 Tax=Paracoccus isoporae TaxID=591205 RepID=A0A1G6TKA4_9RHOB|nr:peptide chain release factor N(5)-glutamine methyltransferase [Paracoccus isoporae]SDD29480.1 release factor glutamine methyltransferase [Paracoccus isoporae]
MTGLTGRALRAQAQERLTVAGVADPRRDATLLLAHALELLLGRRVAAHHLSDHLDSPAMNGLPEIYDRLVMAREARQPVSQITGRRAFWNHEFRVTRDTLDPRPETEVLVAAALDLPWRSVIDLGTGTGAILISLLAARKAARGLGIDISEAALDVARDNAARIGVEAEFRTGNWLDDVTGPYELIVSNPPYIARDEMADLAPEVSRWEPEGALTDGGDGLSAYRAIAAQARRVLVPGGHVLAEIGWQQGDSVRRIFEAKGAVVRLIPDLDGRDRVVGAVFPHGMD